MQPHDSAAPNLGRADTFNVVFACGFVVCVQLCRFNLERLHPWYFSLLLLTRGMIATESNQAFKVSVGVDVGMCGQEHVCVALHIHIMNVRAICCAPCPARPCTTYCLSSWLLRIGCDALLRCAPPHTQ